MTLQSLIDTFLSWLENEVALGESAPRTLEYYQHWLHRFAAQVGGDRQAAELVRLDLERCKTNWHSVQTVQRLFNWALDMELLQRNPFRKVRRPPLGQRTRILKLDEEERMRLHASRPLLDLLDFMAGTICRPLEARTVQWEHWVDPMQCFVLSEFKGKRRRTDGVRSRPLIPSNELLSRINHLRVLAATVQGLGIATGPVLLNERGQAWTRNALRIAVRKACRRAGLEVGDERIVPYTWRHTAATVATANGINDRTLADLMGHASPSTTNRYQHLQIEHLRAAINKATRRPDRPQAS